MTNNEMDAQEYGISGLETHHQQEAEATAEGANDGGPAFPRPPVLVEGDTAHRDYHWMQDGMTLRDWFEGQALNGLLASGQCEDVEQAVMMARDAGYLMLKQRSG